MPILFTSVIPLLSSYLSGFGSYMIYFLGLGLVSACPYIIRRIIDHV